MKSIIFFLLTVFFLSCSQESKEFTVSFGGENFDEGYDIDLNSKGEIILTGIFTKNLIYKNDTILTSNGGYDIYIIKLSNNGGFIWAKNLGNKKHDWGYNSVLDKFDNIYTCGSIKIKNKDYPILSKFTNTGEKVFELTLASVGEFINLSIINQQILVTGSFKDEKKPIFYKLNSANKLIPITKLRGQGRGLIKNSENNIVLYGTRNGDAILVVLDEKFKTINQIQFGTKNEDIVLNCIESDNNYHLVGQSNGDSLLINDSTISLKSLGGQDGFYAIIDKQLRLKHFQLQTSPKSDWSMNLAKYNKGLIMSSIVSCNGTINQKVIPNQKGNYDIILSEIIEGDIKHLKVLSSPLEEGVNKILIIDNMVYLTGWHQGKLSLNNQLSIKDNKSGSAFVFKVKKINLFKD